MSKRVLDSANSADAHALNFSHETAGDSDDDMLDEHSALSIMKVVRSLTVVLRDQSRAIAKLEAAIARQSDRTDTLAGSEPNPDPDQRFD